MEYVCCLERGDFAHAEYYGSILSNAALDTPFRTVSTKKGKVLELPFHSISTKEQSTGLHVNYRFYRVVPKMLRTGSDLTKWTSPDLLVFFDTTQQIDVDESMLQVFNGDSNGPPFVQISFSEKTRVNAYCLVTNEDGDSDFDPVQWEIDGSDDGDVWFGLDLEQRQG